MKRTPYTAPSLARLVSALNITPEQAATIRGLIRGEVHTKDAARFPASNAHFNKCHHEPRRLDRILSCIDETMEGYGVEALWSEKDMYWPTADYINTGDTYSATILFNRETEAFQLTTWGDFYERNQRRYALK